jgi:hypothetical protein
MGHPAHRRTLTPVSKSEGPGAPAGLLVRAKGKSRSFDSAEKRFAQDDTVIFLLTTAQMPCDFFLSQGWDDVIIRT